MLQHVVLLQLGRENLSGYALCSRIEKATGTRPSYGSIYPLLERLTKEGIVTVRAQGRSKVYTLTTKGKTKVSELEQHRTEFVDEEIKRIKRLEGFIEVDIEPMIEIMNRAKRGEAPLGGVTAQAFKFKNMLLHMVQDGRAERHKKEINMLITDLTRKLEKMR